MVTLRELHVGDVDDVVRLSLRAWAPVFASLRAVLGEAVFTRLHPDWRAGQERAVRESCASGELRVFVAVADDRPVGFTTVALDAFHPRMGAIDMIAVDPDHQRQGVARALIDHALTVMREAGMDIAVVETGGDPGHAPARHAYAATGFTLLPIARYFQLLSPTPDSSG